MWDTPGWWRPRCSRRTSPWRRDWRTTRDRGWKKKMKWRTVRVVFLELRPTCSVPEELWTPSCSPPPSGTGRGRPPEGDRGNTLFKEEAQWWESLWWRSSWINVLESWVLNSELCPPAPNSNPSDVVCVSVPHLCVAVHHGAALDHPLQNLHRRSKKILPTNHMFNS